MTGLQRGKDECPKCGRLLDLRRVCSTHGWQAKPWPKELCPYCGGSGTLVTVEDGERPYIRSGNRLVLRGVVPGTRRDCNFCGGTGRSRA